MYTALFCFACLLIAIAVGLIVLLIVWTIQDFREDRKWKEHMAMQLVRGTIAPFIGLINAAEEASKKSGNDRA